MLFAVAVSDVWAWHSEAVVYVVGGVGVLLSLYLLHVVWWLKRLIDDYHHERYSTPEDFPYKFAERVLLTPLVFVAVMWAVFLTDNPWVKLGADSLMTIVYVAFLCVILHPQRKLMSESQNQVLAEIEAAESSQLLGEAATAAADDLSADDFPAALDTKASLTPEQMETYRRLIEHELGDNRAFLDNHYTLQKLAESIRLGRTYTSQVCAAMGGFYNVVNGYRLDYADRYKQQHPEATKETLATESGFSDRSAYYRALRARAAEK